MGLLIDGKWHDRWYDTDNNQGEFKREQSQFRGQIGSDEFPAEADRYHLYVSLACPWAHRALIFRRLKKLESLISVSVVSPIMLEHGWTFDVDQGSSGDPLHNAKYLHELYTRNQHDYSGRVTVPVLWDKKQQRIVNNESADIIRQFNGAFADLAEKTPDYYPESLQADIDAINDEIYNKVNNGVYRCGFATTQQAYEDAYDALFSALDTIENQLGTQRFLCGDTISEADWRLFTTLIRFDAVYHGHFKCNRQRLEDYPHLSNYLRHLYQWPGVADTVDFSHIKRHYYVSHPMINPTQVVPVGPDIDYSRPHNRNE
ncbi:MAG: glutathione S-transferase family protein [Spongiibacter marinus]|uniref:glutathione S-transferase family protein n=1 Tax=Spongiibacter TaxID=630749 RepID=UPI000C0B2E86|nr:glutathione S-transferase family protein [Spongiibacter sp.]MAK45310.1 glutathione-dependent reductase [Spongiibacter sp.]|tara:strand:- start:936 stop:1883 length:948 start_codon:yes stop_codon:yes gene_type:complete